MQKSREETLEYFQEKDSLIHDFLYKNLHNWRFPFITTYKAYKESDGEFDVLPFLGYAISFNKYKAPLREKSSSRIPERALRFIDNSIRNGDLYDKMERFSTALYIADQIVEKIIKDRFFTSFMKFKTTIGSKREASEYIIVDLANVFFKIKEYTGENESLIKFRDTIIGDRSLSGAMERMIEHITFDLNGNNYKFIFITPVKDFYRVDLFEDERLIIPIDCKEYIGEDCSKETLTNEVDDTVLLMLYDYISNILGDKISIMSADNYDFATITQDYSEPLRRAVFSYDQESSVLSWDDLVQNSSGIVFDRDTPLTIFEEDLR